MNDSAASGWGIFRINIEASWQASGKKTTGGIKTVKFLIFF